MHAESDNGFLESQYSLRSLALLAMTFFLIVLVITVLFVVPKIDSIVESQSASDAQVDMVLQAQLFTNYVEGQQRLLQDVAQIPSLVNSAMLSDSSDPVLVDLMSNLVISGERGRMVLQDIAGRIVMQTVDDLQGAYTTDGAWFDEILAGAIPYHFQLLGQTGEKLTFKISVPIKYNGLAEGILSAEITAPLSQVFVSQAIDKQVAFKLVQGQITVATNSTHIEIINEQSVQLSLPMLTFIYITDDAIVQRREGELRNTLLLVLFSGLIVSFLIFAIYGYRAHAAEYSAQGERDFALQAYTIPILVACIGVVASVIAFVLVGSIQKKSLQNERISFAREHVQTIKERVSVSLEVMDAVAAFFYSTGYVSRQQFDTFTAFLEKDSINIQALAWIPNVLARERVAYEKNAALEGITDSKFKELGPDGTLRIAGERDLYFPVYYVNPLEGNEKVFGFDLASNSDRLAALSKATAAGEKIATSLVQLVEEVDSTTGLLIFHPIYHDRAARGITVDRDYSAVRGFVLLVLKADNIFGDLVRRNDAIQSTFVQDVTNKEKHENIFGDVKPDDQLTYSQSFNIAGRVWRVGTLVDTIDGHLLWIPTSILFSGLLISTFVTFILVNLIRRKAVVESIVKQRTADLKMLSSIAANSNEIFIVTEAEEHDEESGFGNILYVNDAFTHLTGYSASEVVGKDIKMLTGANTDTLKLEKMKASLMRGEGYQEEMINYTKDDKEYWVEMNFSPIRDERGNTIQYAAIYRDITDRIEFTKERERLIDELSSSNEELVRFAYVCSHDLQEPLRMIRSFSDKLRTHISEDLEGDAKGQKYFRFVIDGAARAQELIADILAYSSIDSDTQRLESTDGNKLLDDVKGVMEIVLQECGGTITHDVMPELHGNKTQLYQLFQNVLNNAVKYRKHGVPPRVHVKVVDFGELWQFSVSDNGIGMEQRHLDKIFDVFQRLHRRSEYAGTGVGLSICKKVVERHGGRLWVESEHDVGTTFHFTILKYSIKESVNGERRKVS